MKNIKSLTLYEDYNKENKCKKRVILPVKDYNTIQKFKYRTGFLQFLSCKNKDIKFSFVLLNSCLKNNSLIWTVRPNELFINDEVTKNYQKISGKNIICSLDSVNYTYWCIKRQPSPLETYELCTNNTPCSNDCFIGWRKYPNKNEEVTLSGEDLELIINSKNKILYDTPVPSFD